MLILARYVGEKIRIGATIEVEVLEIARESGRARVRLGVTAPADVRVDREEIAQRRAETP